MTFKDILGLLNWQKILGLIGAASLSVAIAFGAGYWKGYRKATVACEINEAQKTIKGINNHADIKTKVMRLPDPELDKRLDKWMRD